MKNGTPTWPATTEAADPMAGNASLSFRVVKLLLYVVIFLVSAVGNSLVCVVVLRKREMKTVTNYFILNLAIADLMLTCICIPFDIPVQEMNNVWPYGAFMCRVLYPLQTLTLFASVYTLTGLSLSRYWAIVHPMKTQLTTGHAKLIICVIWSTSLIIVSPYVAVSVMRRTDKDTLRCVEAWDGGESRAYTVALFVFQYLLPLSIIACAYYCIGVDLKRRARNENRVLQDIQSEETRKIVRMLKVVTTIFAVCVLPTNIMWLWLDFGEADKRYRYFWELVALCNILTFSNSASNPICYTILSENFRNEFKEIYGKCASVNKLPGSSAEMKPLEIHSRGDSQRFRSSTTTSAL